MTTQPHIPYIIVPETADYRPQIELLHAKAFGPGRYTKAAFRLREQGPHQSDASLMALDHDGALLGACWMTPVYAGQDLGFLLGPLAVQPEIKNRGIGRALMTAIMDHANQHCPEIMFVALVGDAPYYAPFGFSCTKPNSLIMPGPVHPARMLVAPLRGHPPESFSGTISHAAKGPAKG